MKKIYFTLSLLLSATAVVTAQVDQGVVAPANKTVTTTRGVNQAELAKKSKTNDRSTQSFWMNYGTAIDSSIFGGGLSELNQNYLCTDSALLGNFGGSYAGVWVNHLGDVLDVRSAALQNYYGYSWNNANSYSVDSMSVMYAYTRALPTNIVDTLMVYLYYNTTNTIMPTYYFTGMQADYGSDTLYFKALLYSYATNTPSASNKITIKVPLTDQDTAAAFFRFKDFAVNYNVPGGKLVACTMTFKPGYSYVAGDSIDNKNAFYFASYEEQGAGTFPLYTYCPNTSSSACDWNSSHIVPSDVRYNNEPNWNGFYIPAYAYTAPYGFEHHLWWYKVTSTNVGVPENENDNVSLEQNIPNPANGNTIIHYTLGNDANSVSLAIYDITGKQVMNFSQGKQHGGEYQVQVNTGTLPAGVYFYTLTVDNQQVTRRMVIAE
jgi:Secretion system C-terminal sorting domain